MGQVLTLIVLLILVLLVSYVLVPQWRGRRAVSQVIRIFRINGAVDDKHARTASELGLTPRSMLVILVKGRDYKIDALKAMVQNGIIVQDASGRLYLSEERLASTGFGISENS